MARLSFARDREDRERGKRHCRASPHIGVTRAHSIHLSNSAAVEHDARRVLRVHGRDLQRKAAARGDGHN